MAQQTQIDRVGPKWEAFLAAFPSFRALAAAAPADVLRAWAGLGYNRRALNLRRTARVVVDEHDAHLPSDLDSLMALPGIGPYTARAVAAIAFGRQVGAVDTNVRRVLGRLTGAPASEIQSVADAVVPADRPADWTHAVMDVGATFCRASRPRCGDCPALAWCRYATNSVSEQPSRRQRRGDSVRFELTSRWLRGRILERVRVAEGWVLFDGRLGEHDRATVATALAAMAAEGLIELQEDANVRRARLPLT
jgi:A/G-specific adenine glycosylase